MSRPIAILLMVVSVILIVLGRLSHRNQWGNWIPISGFAVLPVAGALTLPARGCCR